MANDKVVVPEVIADSDNHIEALKKIGQQYKTALIGAALVSAANILPQVWPVLRGIAHDTLPTWVVLYFDPIVVIVSTTLQKWFSSKAAEAHKETAVEMLKTPVENLYKGV